MSEDLSDKVDISFIPKRYRPFIQDKYKEALARCAKASGVSCIEFPYDVKPEKVVEHILLSFYLLQKVKCGELKPIPHEYLNEVFGSY